VVNPLGIIRDPMLKKHHHHHRRHHHDESLVGLVPPEIPAWLNLLGITPDPMLKASSSSSSSSLSSSSSSQARYLAQTW
jgi:hypothetical protein